LCGDYNHHNVYVIHVYVIHVYVVHHDQFGSDHHHNVKLYNVRRMRYVIHHFQHDNGCGDYYQHDNGCGDYYQHNQQHDNAILPMLTTSVLRNVRRGMHMDVLRIQYHYELSMLDDHQH